MRLSLIFILVLVSIGQPLFAECQQRCCSSVQTGGGLTDAPLAQYQVQLLDVAMEAASAMPLEPHIKNRSRAQADVIEATLDLDQSRKAKAYIQEIANWRRGLAWAQLAMVCAEQNQTQLAEIYIAHAKQELDSCEDWRRDRIRVKIAQVYACLGRGEDAARWVGKVEDSEAGTLLAIQVEQSDVASLDILCASLDKSIATKSLDLVKHAIEAYVRLFEKVYIQSEQRTRIQEKIFNSWDALPIFLRIEVLADMAQIALDHDDKDRAIEFIDRAQAFFHGSTWNPEHSLPRWAPLIVLRYRAGQETQAKAEAQSAWEHYQANLPMVVTIYRAETLRSLAEAYQQMGDSQRALELYRLVIEAGVENPNSRPRAEDLSATCCSMALCQVEPDAQLWKRIHEINQGLGEPW